MAVLPAGLARGHRGNPAASLRIQLLYGAPKLLSGLSSQILSLAEKKILHQHYKQSLERLQRLHKATPEAVVQFLGGSLPLTGLLEQRQINLFGMISRLDPRSILHRLAVATLSTSKRSSRSWFLQVRDLCAKYSITDPLAILSSPPTKYSFNRIAKSKIIDFWEKKLRPAVLPQLLQGRVLLLGQTPPNLDLSWQQPSRGGEGLLSSQDDFWTLPDLLVGQILVR